MQLKYHTVTIEDLAPKDHLPRKVEAMLDLSFVYEETAHLYSRNYGRPAIDPVVLVGKQRKKRTKVLKPKHPHRRGGLPKLSDEGAVSERESKG